jgi:hypothetical protein
MSSTSPEQDPAGEGARSADPDAGESDATQEAFDQALFDAKFEDLPLVREVRELLASRGYSEKDPLRVQLDIAAAFAHQLQALSRRNVHLHATQAQHMQDLKEEIANLADAIDSLSEQMEANQASQTALSKQFETVLQVCGKFVPFLERAAVEIKGAAALIENRSLKAVVLSYLAPAVALCAGFLLALIFK